MQPHDKWPFALPQHLRAKTDPVAIGPDTHHFRAVESALDARRALDADRLDQTRRRDRGHGEYALERDAEIRRLTGRLRQLDRFGVDMVLGRMDPVEGEPLYIGRMGLVDEAGQRLVHDWRSPLAAPFFAATGADPAGLAARRRYRWTRGVITDYWDEAFTPEALQDPAHRAVLDDQSSFIASLSESRTDRMRDVLGTIQADQDAAIRAEARGVLVVEGGPGTGKTVVALHRAAHLLSAEERLRGDRGVLSISGPEADPAVAELKGRLDLVHAVEPAVGLYEEPPTTSLVVSTDWADIELGPEDWAAAFAASEADVPHNESQSTVRDALVAIAVERHQLLLADDEDASVSGAAIQRTIQADVGLRSAVARARPILRAEEILGDLSTVPAYLRRCAPNLTPEQVRLLQRSEAQAWTDSDIPLLDAMARRIGDPEVEQRRRRAQRRAVQQRATLHRVVAEAVAADDSDLHLMSTLRTEDMRDRLEATADTARPDDDGPLADPWAGPFGHIVVDEAQELTAAPWHMLAARCPLRKRARCVTRRCARRPAGGHSDPQLPDPAGNHGRGGTYHPARTAGSQRAGLGPLQRPAGPPRMSG